jgi:hypothetical protein
MKPNHNLKAFPFIAAMSLAISAASGTETPLPDPDGKPAEMSKPVQVYILMGQSNMVGAGNVKGDKDGTLTHAVKEKGKYPYLVDDQGNWTERKDVRYACVMNNRNFNNEWLSIEGEGKIGPEFGIGHQLGHAVDAPVLILKSCIGNRCLGFDLLPPGSEPFEFEEKGKTMVHAGYKGFSIWEKGSEPPTSGWYAGTQYDADVDAAKRVLKQLDKYYPDAKEYEVAGFFWWQGDKDRYRDVWADRYEANLAQLIKALRKEFDAPEAKFVCATLGQTEKGADGNDGKILDAMFAISDPAKHPEFKGAAATVYSHPLSLGGSSNGHYNGNAETYMNVGEAMGKAMVELLAGD